MAATPQLHAFCSRMRPAMHCFPDMLRNKFFAAVAVGGTRNGGQEAAVMDIINLFGTRPMNLVTNEVGGCTGGKVWSRDQGAEGAAEDQIGMKTVVDLAGRSLSDIPSGKRSPCRGKNIKNKPLWSSTAVFLSI